MEREVKMWNLLRLILEKGASSYSSAKDKIRDAFPDTKISENPERIINTFLYIGGIVAVVMMIVAGIQMTTSAGDPGAVKKAKNTMTYAIVGLVVMILAYAIVNFVVFRVTDS